MQGGGTSLERSIVRRLDEVKELLLKGTLEVRSQPPGRAA
jgi:hypothetical protein